MLKVLKSAQFSKLTNSRLENPRTLEQISDSFPGTLTYMLALENCWNSAPMCSFSPIQGTMSWLVLKFHVTRIWELDLYNIVHKSCLSMRQCEIKDIKFYQVRTKIIALGWYWVTMIFFGQINPKIHCSPDMHHVQFITKNVLSKLMKASWK